MRALGLPARELLIRAMVGVLAVAGMVACSRSSSGAQPAQGGPSWPASAGTVTFALAGGDQPARSGTLDARGDLVLDGGAVRPLRAATRTALIRWVADPATVAADAARQSCDFGADRTFLEITLPAPATVDQPIRFCLPAPGAYRNAMQEIAELLAQ